MKFFSAVEILNSLFFSIIFGIISGCIYKSSVCIMCAIKKTILIPFDSLRLSGVFSLNKVINKCKNRKSVKLTLIEENIFEAILFSLFGLSTIFIIYIFLDGVFRFYIILTVVIFFIISVKTIAKWFEYVFEKIYGKIYFFELLIFSTLLFPIIKVFSFVYYKIIKITAPLKMKYKISKSLCIEKKKINEIFKLN